MTTMSSNYQSLAEKGGRSGSSTPTPPDIRIRQFQDGDADAVRELFVGGLCYGDISTREMGMKSMLTERIVLPAYPVAVIGLSLALLSQSSTMRFLGGLLSLASVGWVYYWRWKLSQSIFEYCKRSLADDLADIGGYYKLKNEKEGERMWEDDGGVSNYWVAEALKADGSTEIAGCVGIDSRTQKDKSHTELRHMSIHPAYRGKGIASLLLRALVSHAKENGVKRILLSTTTWQAGARAMYEKFGWVDRRQEPVEWYVKKAKVHHMEYDL